MSAVGTKESEAREADKVSPPPASDELNEHIDRILEAQRARRWEISRTRAEERIRKIRRIVSWVESHGDDIRRAGFEDFRKPATEVDLTEIYPVLTEARHVTGRLKRWMRPKKVPKTLAMASTSARLHYEAKGVTLILSPWNYPFNLTVVPLISALAAGNTAVLKPSEMTPAMSRLLARMIGELFEPGEVAVVEGAVDAAQALLRRRFDHIFFTGSPRVGKIVMEAASRHLTTVTLELGGKSPVIVDASAHLGDTADKVIWGKFVNQGQTCIAPDYVLVHRSRHDELVDAFKRVIEGYYGADAEARRSSPDLARIVDESHFTRLERLLDRSVEQGAKIAFGGGRDAAERWIEPTLLTDVPEDSPAMEEEIFGPILPIVPFDDLEQALGAVRSREKPLALYAFAGDDRAVEKILGGTSSGGACVNEVALHFLHANLPFGGINHSGHGSSHGWYGFRAFSHERAVLEHHRWSALKLMAPPYTAKVKKLVEWTVKYL